MKKNNRIKYAPTILVYFSNVNLSDILKAPRMEV